MSELPNTRQLSGNFDANFETKGDIAYNETNEEQHIGNVNLDAIGAVDVISEEDKVMTKS